MLSHTIASDLVLVAGRRHIYNILLTDKEAIEYFEVLPTEVLDAAVEGENRQVMMLSKESWRVKSCFRMQVGPRFLCPFRR